MPMFPARGRPANSNDLGSGLISWLACYHGRDSFQYESDGENRLGAAPRSFCHKGQETVKPMVSFIWLLTREAVVRTLRWTSSWGSTFRTIRHRTRSPGRWHRIFRKGRTPVKGVVSWTGENSILIGKDFPTIIMPTQWVGFLFW